MTTSMPNFSMASLRFACRLGISASDTFDNVHYIMSFDLQTIVGSLNQLKHSLEFLNRTK